MNTLAKEIEALEQRIRGYWADVADKPKLQAWADELAALRQRVEAARPVGEVTAMPGSAGGFTIACFTAVEVPVGTKIYAAPAAPAAVVDEAASVRDTLVVAAHNPSSHGGLRGLREIMLGQAERLDAALSGKQGEPTAGEGAGMKPDWKDAPEWRSVFGCTELLGPGGNMRAMLRRIATAIGVSTSYHVAARYGTAGLQADMSMTCTITPWLHADNYRELVEYVESQAKSPNSTPCITSITKLGA